MKRKALAVIELTKLSSYKEKRRLDPWHGKLLKMLLSQPTWTGETSRELTTFHGTRTSTFPNTVDHVGLKDLPQLSLTDSISFWEIRTPPQLASQLK
jgi:hypothetical protein